MNDTDNLGDATARLAAAAEALEQTIARISASHDALHSKVDRIIAAIDEHAFTVPATEDLERRIAALEHENTQLKAVADANNNASQNNNAAGAPPMSAGVADHAGNTTRKTLAPIVSMLLSKSGVDEPAISSDSALLDKALASLSVEQRVAVKAEMARAGIIA
jgi:hypothetical protein